MIRSLTTQANDRKDQPGQPSLQATTPTRQTSTFVRRNSGANHIGIHRSKAQQLEDERYSCELSGSLAREETRSINILRMAVLSALVLTGILSSVGVYLYTYNEENFKFQAHFDESATQILESYRDIVERNLGAVASLSTEITSHALYSNSTFPFVALPDFALRGSHFRALSGSHIVHWLPLVSDENREAWEEYAMTHRSHIDKAFDVDTKSRLEQDKLLGLNTAERHLGQQQERSLAGDSVSDDVMTRPMTVLDDGTGYHPKVWSNGGWVPEGDEPEGSGPYLPTWQRSPIAAIRQGLLNINFGTSRPIGPFLMNAVIREKKAMLNGAVVPVPKFLRVQEANLKISQYREDVDYYVNGLSTFMAYPVFDKLVGDKQVAGILGTNVYWEVLLSNLLPASSKGIICVVQNSFNQTFSYRIDGPKATRLGLGDRHNRKYDDDMEYEENINEYLQKRASPRNRAYSTVPLSDSTQYTIRVYPSQDTENMFITNQPVVYTVVVIISFAVASILFMSFSYYVEKRQHMMIAQVVENAKRVAATERELNEFLAHEVRNPLTAAMSACSFLSSAVDDTRHLSDPETMKCVREDLEVVTSSLAFINEFMRSMLDIHRSNENKISFQKSPTDLLQDILEPISAILYKRVARFKLIIDCPENLMVETDRIRLKQVVLNLVCNASKFVEHGFIRLRVEVVDEDDVRLYVEDSGPGVPAHKRPELFCKYQQSLDVLSQGTGLGLNLSSKLMSSMGGALLFDEGYDSGIEGCPGACFVVQLNTGPIDVESTMTSETESMESKKELMDDTGGCDVEEGGVCVLTTNDTASHEADETSGEADQTTADLVCQNHLNGNTVVTTSGDTVSQTHLNGESVATTSTIAAESQQPKPPIPKPILIPISNPKADTDDLPDKLSVLFVDDDAVLRKLFMRAVRKAAPTWNVKEASSGEMALKLCEEESFDIIFLDQYMASVDRQLLGTETAQAMRMKNVQSVICGLSANELRDSFMNSGADDFLMKPLPCKVNELQGVLSGIVRLRGVWEDGDLEKA